MTSQNQARERQLEELIDRQVDEYKKKTMQNELDRLRKLNNVRIILLNKIKLK